MAQPLPSWGSAMDAAQPVQERSDISFDSAELGRLLAGSDDEGDACMQPPPEAADAQALTTPTGTTVAMEGLLRLQGGTSSPESPAKRAIFRANTPLGASPSPTPSVISTGQQGSTSQIIALSEAQGWVSTYVSSMVGVLPPIDLQHLIQGVVEHVMSQDAVRYGPNGCYIYVSVLQQVEYIQLADARHAAVLMCFAELTSCVPAPLQVTFCFVQNFVHGHQTAQGHQTAMFTAPPNSPKGGQVAASTGEPSKEMLRLPSYSSVVVMRGQQQDAFFDVPAYNHLVNNHTLICAISNASDEQVLDLPNACLQQPRNKLSCMAALEHKLILDASFELLVGRGVTSRVVLYRHLLMLQDRMCVWCKRPSRKQSCVAGGWMCKNCVAATGGVKFDEGFDAWLAGGSPIRHAT